MLADCGIASRRKAEEMIAGGDEHARLVYDAMALNVCKNIGKVAPGVCGKVDAILLTGGIAYSDVICNDLKRRVGWIADFVIYPGEDELLALVQGGLRVMNGEEAAKEY